jgi:hypothetical protein
MISSPIHVFSAIFIGRRKFSARLLPVFQTTRLRIQENFDIRNDRHGNLSHGVFRLMLLNLYES